jgi:hypothetical protein
MSKDHIDLLIVIDGKVDEVKEKLQGIQVIQARMESDLKYHIKRTDLLEEKVFDIDEKIQPVESAKNTIWGFGKLIAFITGVIVAILTILESLKKH